MTYQQTWRRTFAEWNWDDNGWFPTTNELEPWPSYFRRIVKRCIPVAADGYTDRVRRWLGRFTSDTDRSRHYER